MSFVYLHKSSKGDFKLVESKRSGFLSGSIAGVHEGQNLKIEGVIEIK